MVTLARLDQSELSLVIDNIVRISGIKRWWPMIYLGSGYSYWMQWRIPHREAHTSAEPAMFLLHGTREKNRLFNQFRKKKNLSKPGVHEESNNKRSLWQVRGRGEKVGKGELAFIGHLLIPSAMLIAVHKWSHLILTIPSGERWWWWFILQFIL